MISITTPENITQAINSFWETMTTGEYNKARREEIKIDIILI